MAIYRATQLFFGGDMPEAVQLDDLYTEDHELVRRYPSMFVEVKVHGARNATVEAMTAAPGEVRRGPGRPPKVREP